MGCRNKHWSQHFILIFINWFICPRPSPWGTACTGLQRESKLINKIKIWLNRCDMCLFLQPMLSARIPKSIFDFRIWIPNTTCYFNGFDYNRYNFSTIFTQQKFCGGTVSPQKALLWKVQFQFSLVVWLNFWCKMFDHIVKLAWFLTVTQFFDIQKYRIK